MVGVMVGVGVGSGMGTEEKLSIMGAIVARLASILTGQALALASLWSAAGTGATAALQRSPSKCLITRNRYMPLYLQRI